MRFIPSIWIKICSLRTDFKKTYNIVVALVISILLFPLSLSACTISCKTSLNISLNGSGQALITPSILLQDPGCDPANFTVDITDPQGNSVGNTLTCDHVGLTMTATVTQTSTGNSCWTSLNVGDFIKPQLICSDTVVLCNESVDPSVIGYPLASDNCTVFANTDLTYLDEFMDLACFTVVGTDTVTSQIQRTWSVQDEHGNSNSCIQMIYLKRVTIDDVAFPAHRDGFAAPALDCSQDPMDLSLTGEPTVNGNPIDNGGDCELVVSFSDQTVPLCGTGSYRVLRTWTVIDYCSGDFTLNVQIINLEDTTAPEITCPNDITINTLLNDCYTTVSLPAASTTDDCSNVTVTPSWAFGSGFGPFFNVPVGVHTVTYTAEDDCGNSTICTMNVTINDNVPPVPICDNNTVVDLTIFGTALVYATTFDDGSYDNCGIDSMGVSRDGINFLSYVSFDCNDIENSPIPVTFRVWDAAGNYNECDVTVIVDDKLTPAIACPSDVFINCFEDYTDLGIVGEPIIDDNCTIDTSYFSDVIDLNNCNEGTISRTWTVVDVAGNISSCAQTITLEDNTPLSIIWPNDYVTSICGAETDVSITGEPSFINADCEDLGVGHTDQIIPTSPSCYRIFRVWEVFEWCIYDPNSGNDDGYSTHLQIIDVEDHAAPDLVCPTDTSYSMFAANCDGMNIIISLPEATDCNSEVEISNDSPYANSNGADASGFYPPGIHTITYTATDGCGNYTNCSQTITIYDAKPPTPICSGGVNVNIGNDGTVQITPAMIDIGSNDNCTSTENLIITVSPTLFTCDDLGSQTVTLTVMDEAGNSAFCTTTINVQDNDFVCSNSTGTVAGNLTNENGIAIQLADVIISGDVVDTVSCDENGYFEFPELPIGGSYEIRPEKDILPDNGLSTFDLVHMQRHVLSIAPINSPYKMIAADINKSGSISTFDMVMLRRLILQIDTVFSNNTSWRFVESSFVFPDPTNPFLSTFPESITISNFESDIMTADFIGVKIGDVSGNANPAEFGEGGEGDSRENPGVLKLSTEQIELVEGDIVEVPIYAEDLDQLLGYQFTIEFDEQVLSFLDYSPGCLENLKESNFNFNSTADGKILTSWTNDLDSDLDADLPMFILHFHILKSGSLKNHLNINSERIKAEAYSIDLEVLNINFEFFETQVEKKEQFMLNQNYPNPFDRITTVPFYLEQAANISFQVFDLKGTQVYNSSALYNAGTHKLTLDRSNFGAAGIFYLKMTHADGSFNTIDIIIK